MPATLLGFSDTCTGSFAHQEFKHLRVFQNSSVNCILITPCAVAFSLILYSAYSFAINLVALLTTGLVDAVSWQNMSKSFDRGSIDNVTYVQPKMPILLD